MSAQEPVQPLVGEEDSEGVLEWIRANVTEGQVGAARLALVRLAPVLVAVAAIVRFGWGWWLLSIPLVITALIAGEAAREWWPVEGLSGLPWWLREWSNRALVRIALGLLALATVVGFLGHLTGTLAAFLVLVVLGVLYVVVAVINRQNPAPVMASGSPARAAVPTDAEGACSALEAFISGSGLAPERVRQCDLHMQGIRSAFAAEAAAKRDGQ